MRGDETGGSATGRPGQLPLGLEPRAGGLIDRVRPMLPTDGEGPFDDPDYLFEPWWPGIRAFVSVEDGRVRVRAESLVDPARHFPELAGLPLLVREDGVVLDATLMVLDGEGRPDTRILDERLAAGDPVRLIGTAALVASDLIVRAGRDLASRPFGERRAALEDVLEPAPWCMVGRGFVGEGTRVASVLGPLGFRAMSARRLDARLRRGRAGDAWFRVPLVAAPRALPAILAVVQRLPL